MVDGRTEEEFRADINRAIADTDDEIFRHAMSDQELDNDGDDSLEQMPDSPVDEEVEDEDEPEVEAEGEEPEEEPPEEEEEGEPEGEVEEPRQEPERRQGIPSYRVREESEARRQAEERAIALERELAQMRGRVDEMSTRINQPQPQPQRQERPPKPDRYTDEAAYDEWMLAEGERRAAERFEQRFAQMQQQQQAVALQRAEASFSQAALSDDRPVFLDAYDRLTRLDPRDPANRAIVGNIIGAPDPAAALFQWFEGNQTQPRRARGPVHETRLPTRPPQRSGPPSLNSVGGGGPGQRVDPELYDDSDAAVFRYATR
jgi:hypothetical protein